MRICSYILFALLLFAGRADAQSDRLKSVCWISGDSLMLDSLPLILESVRIPGYTEHKDFKIHYSSSVIQWVSSAQKPDSLWVYYRTLNISLNQQFRHKWPSNIERFNEEIKGYVPSPIRSQSYDNVLNTAGNLSRGVGFGNIQDVAVNSNLNLRINGIIAGDVELLAAISDDNNPIQPEGNTQQLQDFDRVFIQLKRQQLGITLGDFEMQKAPEDYFLSYYKKSRGLHVEQQWKKGVYDIGTSFDFAVARGRFSRNVFDGLEGNRGPYRLKGSNGEIFIIIIAGTERIYLDGKLLVRGEQNDYTIDYNSGELIFMPRVVITRFSRIIAEFQYSDRNYARSVLQNRTTFSRDQTVFYVNLFREADSKNQPFQQSLDGYDSTAGVSALDMLAMSGDAPQAYIPRIKKTNIFLTDRIMYRRLADGVYAYAAAPGEDSAYYEVAFSYLGPGKGNYRQQQSGANGKVFVYVPPVLGIPQGDYEPVDVLIPPKTQGMATAGVVHTFKNNARLKIESAFSLSDLNTFSGLDDQDNIGSGLKATWDKKEKQDSSKPWRFHQYASFEYTAASFRYIERYRDVEFNRNWNRTLQNPESGSEVQKSADEWNGDARIQAFYKDQGTISFRSGTFVRGTIFKGFNQELNYLYQNAWIRTEGNGSWLNSVAGLIGNQNYKADSRLSLVKVKWQPAIYVNGEQSTFEMSDSLTPLSFRYFIRGVTLNKMGADTGWSVALDAYQRNDDQISENGFQAFTEASNVSVNLGYRLRTGNHISLTGTYRNLKFAVDSLNVENTLQARFESNFQLLKNALGLNTFIQTGTGQEQRREYSYLQVQSGNGVYVWNDYDSNGVPTLNEFEQASELDRNRADYIRVFTPVQGFIQSIQTQYNQTIRLDPGKMLYPKHWLNRISAVGVFTMDRKLTQISGIAVLNPFYEIQDSQLVSTTGSIRGTLFFNRSSPVFGMDYNFISNQNKSLLVNGFEWRIRSEHQGRVRWNFDKRYSFLGEYKQGLREYQSDFFTNRNFQYRFVQIEPRIQYQYKGSFRTSLFYRQMKAYNAANFGGQRFGSNELGAEMKWLRAEKGNVGASVSLVETNFKGDASSSLGYDLLQGLQPGRNFKWNLNAERRVAQKVQLSLNYEARRGLQSEPIHTGRIMARYIF